MTEHDARIITVLLVITVALILATVGMSWYTASEGFERDAMEQVSR